MVYIPIVPAILSYLIMVVIIYSSIMLLVLKYWYFNVRCGKLLTNLFAYIMFPYFFFVCVCSCVCVFRRNGSLSHNFSYFSPDFIFYLSKLTNKKSLNGVMLSFGPFSLLFIKFILQ